jgi:GDP-L-fucose synthase
LAALVGGVYKHIGRNLDFFRINLAINENVIMTSYEKNVKKVVSW